MKFNLLFVLFTFLAHRFLPKYDVRMQLLLFQIRMLRDRIDDQRIVPTPEERAELLRLGNEINHDVTEVMLVVKPQTYRRWLSPRAETRSPKPAGRPGTAEDIVSLILRMEFLDGKGIESDGPLSTKQRLTIQKAFDDYWQVGGFHDVNRLDQWQRIEAHQANWYTILASIIGQHNISHPRAVIDLAHWLVDNTGSYYAVCHHTDYLKSLGHRVRKSSVIDWLAAFEVAGLLFSVNIFSSSPTRISVNPRKVYCIDHALAASVSSGILTNRDSLMENPVFTALRRASRAGIGSAKKIQA